MSLFSNSNSQRKTTSNTYSTKTTNLNLQNTKGNTTLAGVRANSITLTDHGAVKQALATVDQTNQQAINFVKQSQANITQAERMAIASGQADNTAALNFAKNAMTTAAASQRSDTAQTMMTLIKWGAGGAVVIFIAMAAMHHGKG